MNMEKAKLCDLKEIVELFKRAIIKMDENNIPQWDELYPDESILKCDIEKNEMYVWRVDNKIASVAVLNKEYDEEYSNGKWKYPNSEFRIIHRLCVNPDFQSCGIGTKTMKSIEEYLKLQKIDSIRLDAFSLNPYALKMYEKLGYEKVGKVQWRKGIFYLYEKKLY